MDYSVGMVSRRLISQVLVGLALLSITACGSSDNSALNVAAVEQSDDPFRKEASDGTSGKLVRAATTEGLVAFDEAGRVVPALADRWIITDDGQSYIFRLREGNWVNGDPITANSARKAINATLKSLRNTPMGLDLAGIDEVRAMAGRVIEIRLVRPMPYLLQLLAQPELGVDHDGSGSGPMAMNRQKDIATLVRIEPSKLGLPAIENWSRRTRVVRLHSLAAPAAVQTFNDGGVDLVLGGRIQDFTLTRSVGLLRGTIQVDPVVGLFGLQVMNDKGFLAGPANREALAMAIDRPGLIAPFGLGGWSPTTRIVTPSLDGDLGVIRERWADQSLDDRRATAAARVQAWRVSSVARDVGAAPPSPAATQPVRVTIWLPAGGGSQTLFSRLVADFATIGVRLDRVQDAGSADLTLVDEVARYPRAAWFLNHLSCLAKRGLCDPEADARVAEAASAVNPEQRAAMLTDAENKLTATNIYIPFGTPIRWSLVRGSVDGFATNAWGWHPLMPLSWLPR